MYQGLQTYTCTCALKIIYLSTVCTLYEKEQVVSKGENPSKLWPSHDDDDDFDIVNQQQNRNFSILILIYDG